MNKFLFLLPFGVISSVGVGLGLWFVFSGEEMGETLSSLKKDVNGCYLINVRDAKNNKRQEAFCIPKNHQAKEKSPIPQK